jgi:hypothetical protein
MWLGLLWLPAGAAASLPAGFVGMNLGGPELTSHQSLVRAFDGLAATRVESVRVVFSWAQAQPYANWASVPVSQFGDFLPYSVPTTFAATDDVVGLAAAHHMSVLPVVLYTPYWDQLAPAPPGDFAIPRSAAPYAAYLGLLVRRYGPRGTFWRAHPNLPKEPITAWQIWNEPNIYGFWPTHVSYVDGYVALLRAAHDAIKRADPTARVVLAGMPNYTWIELEKIYRAGGGGLFDTVAVHPYTKDPQGVITILDLVRQVMDRHGDGHKGIVLTELGWPSAAGHTPFSADFLVTEREQASRISAMLPLLAQNARRLRVSGFYYFEWESTDKSANPFAYAGLLTLHGGVVVEKPAYAAFRQAVFALGL